MNIGVPKEIKNGEFRVALTPSQAAKLVKQGHSVCVELDAGVGSGFSNQDYADAGAIVVERAKDAWDVDLVLKVKEPLAQEYPMLRPQLGLFTYLHLASAPALAKALLNKQVRSIAYETVTLANGSLPLLTPMSQVAGRVAMLFASQLLQKNCMGDYPGKGMLFGGITGVNQASVVIIGGGNVGRHAAQVAMGLGASVIIFDQNKACLASLDDMFKGQVQTQLYSPENLQKALPTCDVLLGAALVVGEHAPLLLSRAMIATMREDSLFMDVAIDQGGMSETSRVTSFAQPTYKEEGVIHCCLPNLPAAVAQSSTQALTFATFPYIEKIAALGLEKATLADHALAMGINTWDGELRHEGVKKALATLD